MTRLYLDVSTLMAYWLSESRRLVYIPERFDKLMKHVENCEYFIVFSWMQEKEIVAKHAFLLKDFKNLFERVQTINKAFLVKKDSEQIENAKKLYRKHSSLHFSDAIHLAIAKESAEVLVTDDEQFLEVAVLELPAKHLEELA